MDIPQKYIESKIFTYSCNVTINRDSINGCCPVCREGNSWGKKKRMFYLLKEDYFYCHNCSRSWTPYFWIKQVCGLTYNEILEDIHNNGYTTQTFLDLTADCEKFVPTVPDLPGETVNLSNETQLSYYSEDRNLIRLASYIKNRKIDTATYSPNSLYYCVNDRYHSNRLLIPYTDDKNKIIFYTSRTFLPKDDRPKYLAKFNAEREIFNLNKLDISLPYVFILEGEIDAMFLKNSIAIGGLNFTDYQFDKLQAKHPFHKKVWVFDNYKKESDHVKKKIVETLKAGEDVFIWENEYSEYKDFNDYCVKKNLDHIDPDSVLKHVYTKGKGLLRL